MTLTSKINHDECLNCGLQKVTVEANPDVKCKKGKEHKFKSVQGAPEETYIHVCLTSDLHPYECDRDERCEHCSKRKFEGHDPERCALCAHYGF